MMLYAVVVDPWKTFHVPPEDTLTIRHAVIDSAMISRWEWNRMPVAPYPDPSKEYIARLSCCGESGPEYQGLGCVGIQGSPPVRHHGG